MTHPEPLTARIPTPIDGVAEAWVDTLCALDPDVAVWIGREGSDGFADLSPEGHARTNDEARATLRALRDCSPVDAVDAVTQADLAADLQLQLDSAEAGLWMRDLNVIASPAQGIRDTFDLMPTASEHDWERIAAKLHHVPDALAGYAETLRAGVRAGSTPALRQIVTVAEQAARTAAVDGFFPTFAENASLSHDAAAAGGSLPDALRAHLSAGAESARAAYAEFSRFLTEELAPAGNPEDAIGRDHYALLSQSFLGARIDLDETYEWGRSELERMIAEQERIADEISPGASVHEVVALLEADERHSLQGTAALQEWMQQISEEAITALDGTHFDIPAPVRTIECLIAPTQEGGIYYTSPSDDFSRPGRMWWSVPEGVTRFDTWREKTTVYHEGFPGHHLQLGQAVFNRDTLNTWRRQLAGTSGHAEGWALYAERLMEELGFLADPADRFGMLDAQRMRAARVVLDLGVHLNKPRLDGTGTWDYDYAFEFMKANVNMSEPFVRFEVDRYFGWPGQAPSYKVGQRIWEDLRDEMRRTEGSLFDIRQFHKRALDLGGVGLDTLRAAVRGTLAR